MSPAPHDESTLEAVRPGRGQAQPDLPALTILAHTDAARVGEVAVLSTEAEVGRLAPIFAPPEGGEGHPLLDRCLSRSPVRLTLDAGAVRVEAGATPIEVEVDGVLCPGTTTIAADRLTQGVALCLSERVTLLLHRVPMVRQTASNDLGLIGRSQGIEALRRDLKKVADLDVPVLIRGESGVGKELVARALHEESQRAGGAYVAVNMAAIPSSLAASELFGHERGAFSGADRKREGCFGRAHGGTLFLDEVGDTPGDVQPLLLRALESGEIQPVGAASVRRVDVRVLAATDANLEGSVGKGDFRLPLLQRLAGFQLRVPPLRERREDIGRLLVHFACAELDAMGQRDRLSPHADPPFIPAALVARLARYEWPGNVRQLRNVVRQLVIAGRDALEAGWGLDVESLLPPAGALTGELHVQPVSGAPPVETAPPRKSYRKSADVTEDELLCALREHAYRLGPTAKALNVSRTRLYALVEASDRVRRATDLTRTEIERALQAEDGEIEGAAARLEVSGHALKIRLNALEI